MKNIAILTSGGDSPGMNTVIKSIVKFSIINNLNIFGIKCGFYGLYKNYFLKLNYKKILDIYNKGGTILKSFRFDKFKNIKVRLKCIENIKKNNIDILIIVGGNGSYMGAYKLSKMKIPCICIPASIDNDIFGTDYSIGFFTSLENIVKSIDKIRDTSSSNNRIFIVEVMGRNCGDLALFSSIAGDCEYVIVPEYKLEINKLIDNILYNIKNFRKDIIIIITENLYNINKISKILKNKFNKDIRTIILGHIQRGGNPVSYDRIISVNFSYYAINLILNNIYNKCIGIINNKIVCSKLSDLPNFSKDKNNLKLINLINNI